MPDRMDRSSVPSRRNATQRLALLSHLPPPPHKTTTTTRKLATRPNIGGFVSYRIADTTHKERGPPKNKQPRGKHLFFFSFWLGVGPRKQKKIQGQQPTTSKSPHPPPHQSPPMHSVRSWKVCELPPLCFRGTTIGSALERDKAENEKGETIRKKASSALCAFWFFLAQTREGSFRFHHHGKSMLAEASQTPHRSAGSRATRNKKGVSASRRGLVFMGVFQWRARTAVLVNAARAWPREDPSKSKNATTKRSERHPLSQSRSPS